MTLGSRQNIPRRTKIKIRWLKNRPHKIDESSIFAPKGAPFIFRQVGTEKNHGDRTNTSKDSNKKKHEGRAEYTPLPVRVSKRHFERNTSNLKVYTRA